MLATRMRSLTHENRLYRGKFELTTSRIVVPGSSDFVMGTAITIIFYLERWQSGTAESYSRMFMKGEHNEYQIDIRNSDRRLRGRVYHGSGSSDYNEVGVVTSNNTLYHVAMTRGGGRLKLYLNGTEEADVSASSGTIHSSSSTDIEFGNDSRSATNTDLRGYIFGVQLYDYAFTQAQVQANQGQYPTIDSGLVGFWPLNNNAKDYTANGNDGALTNVDWDHVGSITNTGRLII